MPPSPPQPSFSALRRALECFIASPNPFHILHTIPPLSPASSPPPTLYILDSSFNPPTLAHFHIATSALGEPHTSSSSSSTTTSSNILSVQTRLLLLLATQNADKPPPPQSQLTARLGMMTIFAEEIRAATNAIVDVGVTKKPYFHHKAPAIVQSGEYPPSTPQVYLIGFDTLVRLPNPKYYLPANSLSPLSSLFSCGTRLRVTKRVSGAICAGGDDTKGQDSYMNTLAHRFESEGGRKEWAERIEFVDGVSNDEVETLSSTKVREAVKGGEWEVFERMVTPRVGEWVKKERLYLDMDLWWRGRRGMDTESIPLGEYKVHIIIEWITSNDESCIYIFPSLPCCTIHIIAET